MTRPGRRPSGPPYLHSVYTVLFSEDVECWMLSVGNTRLAQHEEI